jgi:hypothetical protein
MRVAASSDAATAGAIETTAAVPRTAAVFYPAQGIGVTNQSGKMGSANDELMSVQRFLEKANDRGKARIDY